MAQPAHASGLQNWEGEGEVDFYQAEFVNADLVPVEANPTAEKGEVLRALAKLCFLHTPGKFIQPHVIPYFLKACLPERLRPKREKVGAAGGIPPCKRLSTNVCVSKKFQATSCKINVFVANT